MDTILNKKKPYTKTTTISNRLNQFSNNIIKQQQQKIKCKWIIYFITISCINLKSLFCLKKQIDSITHFDCGFFSLCACISHWLYIEISKVFIDWLLRTTDYIADNSVTFHFVEGRFLYIHYLEMQTLSFYLIIVYEFIFVSISYTEIKLFQGRWMLSDHA